jgi:hypothetical protein
MQPPASADRPSVFALLAAQAAAVRDRIEHDATTQVDLLGKAADSITQLVALLDRLIRHAGTLTPELAASCASAEAATTELGIALDERAFAQAQRIDLSRQMADGLVLALRGLDGEGAGLSHEKLAASYVSEEQREVHAVALAGGSARCNK